MAALRASALPFGKAPTLEGVWEPRARVIGRRKVQGEGVRPRGEGKEREEDRETGKERSKGRRQKARERRNMEGERGEGGASSPPVSPSDLGQPQQGAVAVLWQPRLQA